MNTPKSPPTTPPPPDIEVIVRYPAAAVDPVTRRDFEARAHLARRSPAEHLAALLQKRLGGLFEVKLSA